MLQGTNETSYALFLGCLTKILRFGWASVSSISRKTVEETGRNSFTFTNRGIAASTKENHKNISICNQKFELVISQLTILLPHASFSIVTRLRTERSENAGSIAFGGKNLSSLPLHPDRPSSPTTFLSYGSLCLCQAVKANGACRWQLTST
jgi:hypothetical protein